MSDPETYRQYARDCLRFAEKMGASDRRILLNIAEAWEARAREAEHKLKRRTSGVDDVNGAGTP